MIIVKYLCFVVAFIATALYINNFIADFTRVLTWRTSFSGENENLEDDSAKFATMRFILSIIMAFTWGIVIIL